MDQVFAHGHTAKGFPILVRFHEVTPEGPAGSRVAFTVSKRRFRRAVDRNRIKRLMRESWRLHRSIFEDNIPAGKQWAVVLIFVGRDLPASQEVEKGMVKLLHHMVSSFSEEQA